jgi:hypothetical protein
MFILTTSLVIKAAATRDSKWIAGATACGALWTALISAEHTSWFVDQLAKLSRRWFVPEAVGFAPQGIDQSLVHDLSGIILGYMAISNARSAPSGSTVRSILRDFKDFDRTKTGLTSVVTYACELVQKLVNYFASDVLGLKTIEILEKNIPELKRWCEKVDLVVDENRRGLLKINAVNSQRVTALLMEGHHLAAKRVSGIDSIQMRSALSVYMATMRKLAEPFEKANLSGSGPRMEPVCALFRGLPGVGKTYVLYPLMKRVMSRVLNAEELKDFESDFMSYVYNRQAEHKYWDGYRGQPVVIFDDFGQMRDAAGMPDNEYLELIRAGNIHPFICHMADIGAKGTTTFKGKLILATTNQRGEFQPASIWEPQAVMRRFDIVIDVCVKAEFAANPHASPTERVIDKNHEGLRDGRFRDDIYEFYIARRLPSGVMMSGDTVISFDTLVDRIVERYRDGERRMNSFMSHLDLIGRELRPESGVGSSEVKMQELEEFNEEFDKQASDILEERQAKRAESFASMSTDELISAFGHGSKLAQRTDLMQFDHWVEGLQKQDWWESLENHIKSVAKSFDLNYCLLVLYNMNQNFPELLEKNPSVCFTVLTRSVANRAFLEACFRFSMPEGPVWTPMDDDFDDHQFIVKSYFRRFTDFFANVWKKFSWVLDWKKTLATVATFLGVYGVYRAFFKKKTLPKPHGRWVFTRKNPQDTCCLYLADGCDRTVVTDWIESVAMSINRNYGSFDEKDLKCFKGPNGSRIYVYCNDDGEDIANWIRSLLPKVQQLGIYGSLNLEEPFDDDNLLKPADAWELLPDGESLIPEHGPYPMRKGGKKHRGRIVQPHVALHPEGGADPNLPPLIDKVIRKNQYELTMHDVEGRFGFVTFVRGRVAYCPDHYRTQIKAIIEEDGLDENATLYLRNIFSKTLIPMPASYILNGKQDDRSSKNDLLFFEVPFMQQHPDIIRYFVTREQFARPLDIYLQLIGSKMFGGEGIQIQKHAPARRIPPQRVTHHDPSNGSYSIMDCLWYEGHTTYGDCGMLLAMENRSIGPGKFLGIHVAGDSRGGGVGVLSLKEDLEDAMKLFGEQLPPPPEVLELTPQCMEVPFKGNFMPYFKLDKPISQPMSTKIRKSRLYNMWTRTEKAPARLAPKYLEDGTILDPRVLAIEKYGAIPIIPNYDLIDIAGDYIYSKWVTLLDKNHKGQIFNFEDACRGIEGVDFCNSIPRNTSAGYPYVTDPQPGFRGKEFYFGRGEEYDFSSKQCQELKASVLDCIEKARHGERSLHVYVDALKDELRKISRVEECKTRLISGSPLRYTILCRMYFLDWTMWMMKKNVGVWVGVGINPYSEDWDFLSRHLKSMGPKVMAGDYSGFDTSQYAALFEKCVEIINRWYNDGEENARIRRVLFADLWNSIHVNGDIVYQWMKSLPSGHFLTAMINSLVNLINHVKCWMKLHPRGIAGLGEFDDNVAIVAYGDDVALNVSDYACEFYNYVTISRAMATFGFTYTDEMKSGSEVLYRSLDEITFLKRGFRNEPLVGRYVAPLALSSILDMLYFTKKGADSDMITKDNVCRAVMELSLHSKEDFVRWAPKVLEGAREKLNFQPPVIQRAALLKMTCQRIDYL